MTTPEIWHFDARRYRLVDRAMVSYPRSEQRAALKGKLVTVDLSPLQYSIVTAQLIGDDANGDTI